MLLSLCHIVNVQYTANIYSKCLLHCERFFDRPVVPLPPPPEAWQHHPPVEPLPPQWGRGLAPEFPPRFLPPPEVPLVSHCFSVDATFIMWHIDVVCSAVYAVMCDSTDLNMALKCVRYIFILTVVFRPHRSTTYIDAAYCYRPSSVVCLSQLNSTQRVVTDAGVCTSLSVSL